MIVIEGLDATGKSTLANYILTYYTGATRKPLNIQESEGPPKYKGEMNERIRRYNADLPNTLFVRHPVVSNTIYDHTRSPDKIDPIDPDLVRAFYAAGHFFIYCDPPKKSVSHEVKCTDTEDHLRMISQHRKQHMDLYRSWAVKKAHVLYRIGDDMNTIARICTCVLEGEA